MTSSSRVGCVVIGRNEGERLVRCLESLAGRAERIVYVDSGSTDGSVEHARSKGVEVVALDMSRPFTAARARNEGFDRLISIDPRLDYVQFVDGDCEVVPGWLETAAQHLDQRAELAVVCGRRRERHPDASIYNQLCDIEWDTPIGDTDACGGDALMRVHALREVGGFDPELIAGEEPELCFRLRQRAWKITRIDAEMTLHDAAMTEFTQWWKRNVRSGYAFAEGAWMHGRSPERYRVKEATRILFWAGALPAMMIGAVLPTLGTSLFLGSGYFLNIARIYSRTKRRPGLSERAAFAYAVFTALGRVPELQGALRFAWGAVSGKRSGLIEYKTAQS